MENSRGYEENPIDYVIRHTQLLPRQILIYFNSAIEMALNNDVNTDLTKLSASYIREAVESHEGLLAAEIVDSYRAIYPEGRELLRRIINFPILANSKSLKGNWSKYEAKRVLSKYDIFPQVKVESDRFIDFLTETGIIGIVQAYSDSSKYINVEFEYTLPNHIKLQPNDTVAVHPIFSSITCKSTHADLRQHIGIYPKGTGISEEQDKKSIKNKFIKSA